MSSLNRRDAYETCMTESLKNAEMWLKESRLIVESGSKGHAQALTIFAAEEVGKAMTCWIAINKVMPFNHPEVEYQCSKSVFRKHYLKGGAAIGFSLALSGVTELSHDTLVKDPVSGQEMEYRQLLLRLGDYMAQSRMKWMYVDIKKGIDGIEVHSPLQQDPVSIDAVMDDVERSIAVLRAFIELTPEFKEVFKEIRVFLEENDDRFPKKPEWD